MIPTTENPRKDNTKRGQKTKKNLISLYLVIIPIVFMIFSLSDGMAKSITGMSILSEPDSHVEAGYIGSGKSDISIASAGSIYVATGNNIISQSLHVNLYSKGKTLKLENFSTVATDSAVTTPSSVQSTTKPKKKEIKRYSFKKVKYIKASSGLNVRSKPTTKSKVLDVFRFGKKIKCSSYNKNWVIIKYKKKKGKIVYGYLSKKYLQNKKPKYIVKNVYGDRRKSYMDYRCITSKSSPQYKLQQIATTASNGVRTVNGRYCIALGSYFTSKVGKYVDLVLANGNIIQCVIGDQKKNRDTNSQNAIGNDGSAAEFIVETSKLNHTTHYRGNVSFASKGWNSKVVKVRLYNKNAFSS